MLNYTSIPLVVVICYLFITAIKGTKIKDNFYPVISCAVGMLCTAAMHLLVPEFIGASGLVSALISGAASGLAATGTNQVFKQLLKSAQDGTLTTKDSK